MREELLEHARTAVQIALDVGADDAVAGVARGRALEFRWRDGKLEKVQEDASRGLGISLYVDGRFSGHSTNDLDPGRLKLFLADAVTLTRHLEPDPYRKITPPELYEGRQDIDLDQLDPSLGGLERDTRIAWAETLSEIARVHEAVISSSSGVMDSHGASARVSSNGFEGSREAASIWYGAEVSISDGKTKRPEAYRWVGGTYLDELPTPEDTGKEALRRVLARRGAEKIPSIKATMVVDPEAASPLIGRIIGAMSAGAIQQKRSFLTDSLGKSIASPLLSMTDAPFRKRALGSKLWDSEGIATKQRTIIKDGVLEMFFVDTYYGRKLGWEPTTGSTSNVVFDHGDKDLAAIITEVGEGIYVNSWLGGNADMTTGDYSFGVRGHVIRGGELAEPISEMNVAGNYADLLQRLSMVGNDPVPWASFRAPTLVFDGVQFAGL